MQDSTNQTLIPTFIIYINGVRFTAEQEADVMEIDIYDKINGPSTFQITLSDMNKQWIDFDDFSEGSEVKIMLGYKDKVEELIYGEITEIQSILKNTSARTRILGSNHLHRLLRGRKTRYFTNMSDSDILKQIADDAGLANEIEALNKQNLFTIQKDQTDYDYLMMIARQYNCVLYAKDGKLYFKKREDISEEKIILEWGKTLLDFTASQDTKDIVTEVEVHGWNENTAEAIIATKKVDDITNIIGGDILGGTQVLKYFGEVKTTLISHGIEDQKTAEQIARDLLTENSMKYISAAGSAQGNNKIRAGINIEIKEVGARLSGPYYVKSAKHKFRSNRGYTTYFELARNASGS